MNRRPIRRRSRAVLYPLMAAILAATLIGCSAGPTPPPTQPTGGQQAVPAIADELVVALTPDPTAVDPRVAWSMAMFGPIQFMFEPLVFRDANMKLVGVLAEKWEQTDPTHLKMYLRKGVKFHNGEDFNAAAVKFTFDTYLDKNLKFTQKSFQPFLAALDRLEVVDEHTVEFVTKKPSRSFITNLTLFGMVPPKQAAADMERFGTRAPSRTGPYKFVEYIPGTRWVMERNPNYWGTPAKTKRITIRFIADDSARVAALESGEVQMINNVPPDAIDRLKSNANLQILSSPTARLQYIEMMSDRPPFNNPKVRKALNYAIDRETITRNLFQGLAEPARSVYYKSLPAYNDKLTPYEYSPEKAKALLAEAGFPNGVKFKFGYSTGRYLNDKAVGEALVAQMKAAGFDADAETGEWGAYYSKARGGAYDAYTLAFGAVTFDPAYALTYFLKPTPSKWEDQEVWDLMAAGDQTIDVAKAEESYLKAQELLWDRGPWVSLYFVPEVDAGSKKLKGFAPRPDEYILLQNATLEK